MKKTAAILLIVITAGMAQAQSAYDAWLFSENNYEGTARSVAMGNAFTALGGDLGAVTINPAGSAVAGYSQFTLTPSITFSTNTSVGVPYEGSSEPYFQKTMKSRMVNAGIPNIGFTFNFDTGRNSGLKSITAGFVMNCSNSWCEDLYANGTNSETSFLAATADDMSGAGILPEALMDADAYNNPGLIWKDIVAYRSGMVSSISAYPDAYVGATENMSPDNPLDLQQGGPVDQTYGRAITGTKTEYLLNLGANISDFIYLGFNLGISSLSYDYTQYFKERAVDPENFLNRFTLNDGSEKNTYFSQAQHKYSYSATGSGVYGKFGIIVTPGYGLRFGAAIQTPAANVIREKRRESAEAYFTDSEFNSSASSPTGEFEYEFTSPFRANFGIAYTLGKFAVISADYEIADFSGMRFEVNRHEMNDEDVRYFEDLNDEIKQSYGAAHHLRVGAEIRPLSTLALRAGYNLASSAQKAYYDSYDKNFHKMDISYRQNLSFGLGYSSKKSFFADLACRYSLPQDEFIIPYSDYLLDEKGIYSPEILNRHSNWKVLLTLGWRF